MEFPLPQPPLTKSELSPHPAPGASPSTDEAWLLVRAQGASPRPQARPRTRPAPLPPPPTRQQGRSSCPSGSGRRCLLQRSYPCRVLQGTLRWAVQAPEQQAGEPPLGGGRQEVLSPSGSRAALGKAPDACGGSWRVGEEKGHLTTREGRSGGRPDLSRMVGTFGSSALDSGLFLPPLWTSHMCPRGQPQCMYFWCRPICCAPWSLGVGDMPTVTQSGQHSDPDLSHESLPHKPCAPLPLGPSLEDLPSHRWPRAENPVSGDRESRQGACG